MMPLNNKEVKKVPFDEVKATAIREHGGACKDCTKGPTFNVIPGSGSIKVTVCCKAYKGTRRPVHVDHHTQCGSFKDHEEQLKLPYKGTSVRRLFVA